MGARRPNVPLTKEEIDAIRSMSRDEALDKLKIDVSRVGQLPPDSFDSDTALVTILDSLSISQFQGILETKYAVKISDEYLFGETTTLVKLAEVVKLGSAPDDVGGGGTGGGGAINVPQGTAGGLAGALGCPPGVYCAIQ